MKKEENQRTFIVGSEWVYYKIYCGINTADSLLINTISPLSERLIEKGNIDKWFFIRYSDPEKHLRIRFHVQDLKNVNTVINSMYMELSSYVESGLVWNVQLDTYKRELERYGHYIISEVESYFYHDSRMTLKIIDESATEEIRFEKSFVFIDAVINYFLESIEEKLTFLERMQQAYKNEFRINNPRKKSLSRKYRSFKNRFNEIENTIDISLFKQVIDSIQNLNKEYDFEVTTENLLSSVIHMTVNRVFQSRQRLYEMVLYDFLYQKCRSDYYKRKQNSLYISL